MLCGFRGSFTGYLYDLGGMVLPVITLVRGCIFIMMA